MPLSSTSSCASDMDLESPIDPTTNSSIFSLLPLLPSSSSNPAAASTSTSTPSSSSSSSSSSSPPPHSVPRLRGLRWRVLLGVLPRCPTTIDELRRAAANGRRKYAELRRRLIIDPHLMEDLQKADLHVDNPLSQDPKSVWGRYFENNKVEGTINTDLARLYPEEHGSFFQSKTCQAILKRVLLVWALIHPQYGYRQGMHELLAPLVYVLHMDVELLTRVRKRYKDPFEDRFDAALEENAPHNTEVRQMLPIFAAHSIDHAHEAVYHGNVKDWAQCLHPEDAALIEPDDFGFSLETMLRGSDSYGAEGELGDLLSVRFLEHDAYCLFDALLKGNDSSLVLADYYVLANEGRSCGMSPILEASAAMYQTLSGVDMPLYSHLVGLGVEPQFFALRWFRVLFGREFELAELLFVWDAIFALPSRSHGDFLASPKALPTRSLFVSNFAVSMLLHLRSALLATSDAASCLQKVLSFPKDVDIRGLIENTKSLEQSSSDVSKNTLSKKMRGLTQLFSSQKNHTKHKSWSDSPFQPHIPAATKGLHTNAPKTVKKSVPESYWEERWMNSVLPKASPLEVHTINGNNKQAESPSNGFVSSVVQNGSNQKPSQHAAGKNTQAEAPSNWFDPSVEQNSVNDVGSNQKPTQHASNDNIHPRTRRKLFATPDIDPLGVTQGAITRNELWISDGETSISGDDEGKNILAEDANAISGTQNSRRFSPDDQTTINSSHEVEDMSLSMQKDNPEAALRTLGHSMVDSIKVLENVLAQKANLGREGASIAFRETVDSFSKAFLSGKGHMAALSALGELRKISNMLLQM